jgi:hypothetical protein
MSKTIVGTHAEQNPKWQAWSQAAAYAEEVPIPGSDAEAMAWQRADQLWAEYQLSIEEQKAARIITAANIEAGQAPLFDDELTGNNYDD